MAADLEAVEDRNVPIEQVQQAGGDRGGEQALHQDQDHQGKAPAVQEGVSQLHRHERLAGQGEAEIVEDDGVSGGDPQHHEPGEALHRQQNDQEINEPAEDRPERLLTDRPRLGRVAKGRGSVSVAQPVRSSNRVLD